MYEDHLNGQYEDHSNDSNSTLSAPPPAQDPNKFIRRMTQEEVNSVNSIIQQSEKITEALTKAWKIRDTLRQVIADMTCPWKVGTIIVLGDGKGPMDRRVVVGVLPGETEKGCFYKVRTRVLKKGATLGKKEVAFKLTADLDVKEAGVFAGVMPPCEGTGEGMVV